MTRFTIGVVLLGWAACAAYPLGLLLTATPADFAFLRTAFVDIPYVRESWYPKETTLLQVHQLRWLLALAVLMLVGIGLGSIGTDWKHRH